jgi:hypothetical protein
MHMLNLAEEVKRGVASGDSAAGLRGRNTKTRVRPLVRSRFQGFYRI